jgi:hypothetical protein
MDSTDRLSYHTPSFTLTLLSLNSAFPVNPGRTTGNLIHPMATNDQVWAHHRKIKQDTEHSLMETRVNPRSGAMKATPTTH